MKKFKVVGIGEILWDMLPAGKQLGGAPANFAYHTQQLGASSSVISAVGNDALGNEIVNQIENKQLNNCIARVQQATGTVSVTLNKGIPSYIINQHVAWDFIALNAAARNALAEADAICFGSLAQRNRVSSEAIYNALELVPDTALKVFDINLRQAFYSKATIEKSLSYANVFKINDEELLVFADLFEMEGDEDELIRAIIDRFELRLLALTKGSDGSTLITKEGRSALATPKVEVADTIGAGDSFTATMVMGLLNEKPLAQLHQEAVDVSAFVCTQKGATPVLPSIFA